MKHRPVEVLARDLVSLSISDRVLLREAADKLRLMNTLVESSVGKPIGVRDQFLHLLRQYMLQRVIEGMSLDDVSEQTAKLIACTFDDVALVLRGEGTDL